MRAWLSRLPRLRELVCWTTYEVQGPRGCSGGDEENNRERCEGTDDDKSGDMGGTAAGFGDSGATPMAGQARLSSLSSRAAPRTPMPVYL
jgi:hypothetical protein